MSATVQDLIGYALPLIGVLVLVAIVGIIFWAVLRAWTAEAGLVAKRVRVELEQREAERQIQHIAYAAMQRMAEETRRQGGSGPLDH